MTLLGFLGVTPPGNIDNFTRAYLETALWAENGGNYETYQKRGFSLNDFTRQAVKQAREDCAEFRAANRHLYTQIGLDDTLAGQHFWLSRNSQLQGTRPGKGSKFRDSFRDRDSKVIVETLNNNAASFCPVYISEGAEGELSLYAARTANCT